MKKRQPEPPGFQEQDRTQNEWLRYPFLDSKTYLKGWPGHRTHPDRSGLDPMDTYNEQAHMEGLFLRRLFTVTLRTRDPFHRALMLVVGIVLLAPVALTLIMAIHSGEGGGCAFCTAVWLAPFGIALLLNYKKNIES